jgi:hypothetical protein
MARLAKDTTIIGPDRTQRLREAKTAGLQAGALWTYLELARTANLTGRGRWQKLEEIATATGETDRTVRRHVEALERAGLVERQAGMAAAVAGGQPLPAAESGQDCPIVKAAAGQDCPKHRTGLSDHRTGLSDRPQREPVQHAVVSPLNEHEGTRNEHTTCEARVREQSQGIASSQPRRSGREERNRRLKRDRPAAGATSKPALAAAPALNGKTAEALAMVWIGLGAQFDGLTLQEIEACNAAARGLARGNFKPDDVPEIAAWLRQVERWRTGPMTPETIAKNASRWRNGATRAATRWWENAQPVDFEGF